MKYFAIIMAFMLTCADLHSMESCSIMSMEEGDTLCLRMSQSIDNNTVYPYPRSIALAPQIGQFGHTLILYSGCDGCTIELRDEDGQTVYSVYVEPGTESIWLPEELAGSFEIRIVRGSLTFVGEIEFVR